MIKEVQDIKARSNVPSLKTVRNEVWYLLHNNNAFCQIVHTYFELKL